MEKLDWQQSSIYMEIDLTLIHLVGSHTLSRLNVKQYECLSTCYVNNKRFFTRSSVFLVLTTKNDVAIQYDCKLFLAQNQSEIKTRSYTENYLWTKNVSRTNNMEVISTKQKNIMRQMMEMNCKSCLHPIIMFNIETSMDCL